MVVVRTPRRCVCIGACGEHQCHSGKCCTSEHSHIDLPAASFDGFLSMGRFNYTACIGVVLNGGAALIGARLRSRALGEVPHSPPIPAEIAWTNSVSAIVAKGSIRPRSLRVPHRSRFRREVLRTGDYRAVSGFVVGFVRPGHRHRVAQGDQRYQHKDGEFHGWDHSTDEARHFHKNVLPGRRCLRRAGPALEQAGRQKVEGW